MGALRYRRERAGAAGQDTQKPLHGARWRHPWRQRSCPAAPARSRQIPASPDTTAPHSRAKNPPKRVNSGSPKHFRWKPSLCRKRLRRMRRKPKKYLLPGLTPPNRTCFSRSHVAPHHATANPHRSRRHRRRIAAFDSCARTYYPTNRCGTSQRVSSNYTGTLQKPAPAPVRVFSFQDLVSDATTMTTAFRKTRTCMPTTPRGGCACAMGGTSPTVFP